MTSRDEEELWRSIVENYGQRPRLDPEDDDRAGDAPAPPPAEDDPYGPPEPPSSAAPPPVVEDEDERFVPPVPPPLPQLSLPRRLAWGAVLGAPLLVLVLALLGETVSSVTGVVVAGVFVTGFGYLVSTMEKGPRDPWDDGSAV